MRRIIKSLAMSIALAALVSVAAAGCTSTASVTSPKSAASVTSPKSALDAQARFAGYKWRVVAIGHAGKETPVPAGYDVYLQFEPDGGFGANDSINYYGGTYHQTRGGFTTSGIYSTLAGYAGHDPVRLLAENAIWPFGNGVHAKARLTGDRLAVTIGGYLLICQRDGRQADIPPT